MGEINAHRILMASDITRKPCGKSRRRWEDNIKLYLREINCEGGRWLIHTQDCVQ
jgi:hypothetical protein